MFPSRLREDCAKLKLSSFKLACNNLHPRNRTERIKIFELTSRNSHVCTQKTSRAACIIYNRTCRDHAPSFWYWFFFSFRSTDDDPYSRTKRFLVSWGGASQSHVSETCAPFCNLPTLLCVTDKTKDGTGKITHDTAFTELIHARVSHPLNLSYEKS